ncbi:MAG: hypothetical protein A2X29_10395 [Elusimicrobia bacterium GWA2_64_40]|nr:MAG: hypothetical protein A2X29_10395 [Elusimicrobia bacterium GWA2_64_40]OGR67922.1 MAG: hypothetical protein A2X30_03010 [Elusimicrobia bacterium GWB2_63_16]
MFGPIIYNIRMNPGKTLLLALAALAAQPGAFAGADLQRLTAAELRGGAAAPPVPRPSAPAVKEWTVMVFVNAKNNLEEFGLRDLNEMESAGSSDQVNIVAELGRARGYYSGDGDWTGVRRYLIRKDADPARLASPALADLGPADMGDYRSVVGFVRWAKAAYPAKKYLLVVWNHGSGWTKAAGQAARGISYDDETGSHITVPQLAEALAQAGGTDVYASDACLMQMAEVAWELKDQAPYVVGSEETEPADGYPYGALLGGLTADPAMSPRALAALAVSSYAAYYSAQGTGATMSALKTSALPEFLRLTGAFTAAAMAAGDKGVVKRGLYYAQHYAYEDNKDLDSFVSYVVLRSQDRAVRETGTALLAWLRGELVAHKAAANYEQTPEGLEPTDYSKAGGLAVYLPGTPAPAAYDELRWAKDSSWDDFLDWIAPPKP